jgi:hypothetical protein
VVSSQISLLSSVEAYLLFLRGRYVSCHILCRRVGSGGKVLLILKLGSTYRLMTSFTCQPIYSRETTTRSPMYGRHGGPEGWTRRIWNSNCCFCRKYKPSRHLTKCRFTERSTPEIMILLKTSYSLSIGRRNAFNNRKFCIGT